MITSSDFIKLLFTDSNTGLGQGRYVGQSGSTRTPEALMMGTETVSKTSVIFT
jgi:hypothetical protein